MSNDDELEKLRAAIAALPPPGPSWDYVGRADECPNGPHRGPQGPCEDLAQCPRCLMPSFSLRPAGETFGEHAEDCSLPLVHEGYCQPGGTGHPSSRVVRGYFPPRASS